METRKEMYDRLQDAAMYRRLQKATQAATDVAKEAADKVKAVATGTSVNQVKGYEMVEKGEANRRGTGFLDENYNYGDDDDDVDEEDESDETEEEEEQQDSSRGISRDDVEYWSIEDVSGFLRRQLLEFEGGDEFGVDAVLETFREQGVDGHALLNLDDEQLRYELDVGVVGMRESILRIVDALKRGVEHSEAQQRLLSSTSSKSKAEIRAEKREMRRARMAQRVVQSKDNEVKGLIRVIACISALTVLYNILAQSLTNWHNRSVMMKGEGETLSFRTIMGLWTFKSTGHYHNNNMYAHLLPDTGGFDWTDDYDVTDSYEDSKWQCKPPSNKDIKDFCSAIRAAQACHVLALVCALMLLTHGLLSVSYERPIGCSRIMSGVAVSQAVFAVATLLCVDAAFTAQLQRYGDKDISASQCKKHYLTYKRMKEDDWYDDDWGYNRLLQNDDHFEVARVSCGYSVAFVLQCFVPFFAVVQAWLYFQLHNVAPNSGEGLGVFLIQKRDTSGALEIHVRTPKQGGRILPPASSRGRKYQPSQQAASNLGTHHVYRVVRKPVEGAPNRSSRSRRGVPGMNSGGPARGDGRPRSAAERREQYEEQMRDSETFGGGYGGDDVSDDEYEPMQRAGANAV